MMSELKLASEPADLARGFLFREQLIKDYDKESLILPSQHADAQKKAVLEWAKQTSNEIVSTVRTSGYGEAVRLAEAFLHTVKKTAYIRQVECLGGSLLDLAQALYFSCRMGRSKEGIVQQQWSCARTAAEYKGLLAELPAPFHDHMINATSLETLFSFTANTVAWLEIKKDYDKAGDVIAYYLQYIEAAAEKLGLPRPLPKQFKPAARLTAAFCEYLKHAGAWDSRLYPRAAALSKRVSVPYHLLAQVYKPRYRLASANGFFQFVARGSNLRRMGYSVACSCGLIGLLLYLLS